MPRNRWLSVGLGGRRLFRQAALGGADRGASEVDRQDRPWGYLMHVDQCTGERDDRLSVAPFQTMEAACKSIIPLMEVVAPQGVSYVGEGDLARICKIAHNVMLGVVIENLIEITLLVNKMGVPRHAFLAFLNNGVMGSMFTAYKSPALVNLDWATTFTPELLRKDLDLGLELGRENGVPMPVTAATREMLQSHFGAAMLKADPQKYLDGDFAALMETMALAAGMKLESENKPVPTGLE